MLKKRELNITELGEPIPDYFIIEAEKAKENVEGLEVNYLAAPRDFNYSVNSPRVIFKSGELHTREYGNDGLSLIKDVSLGKIR